MLALAIWELQWVNSGCIFLVHLLLRGLAVGCCRGAGLSLAFHFLADEKMIWHVPYHRGCIAQQLAATLHFSERGKVAASWTMSIKITEKKLA